jgi:hypothetical protein
VLISTLYEDSSAGSAIFQAHARIGTRAEPFRRTNIAMRSRTFTLVTALGLASTLALQAEAGQISLPPDTPAASAADRPAPSLAAAAAAAATATSLQTPATLQPTPATPEIAKLPVSGGATFDFMSHYVWRGFVLTDAFAFQPAAWVKMGDLTVSSWSSWSEGQDGGPLMEHDLTVDYTRAVGKATLSVGYINYLFPAIDEGSVSNELYFVSAFAAPLNPTVKAYVDVHEGSGTYLNFGISQPLPLNSKLTLTPSFAIGYNHQQWIDESAWNDANFGLKLTVPINAHFTLGPGIYYSKGLNDAIPDKFYGGLSVVTTF